ncbi:MAG: hypothetical protein ABI550_00480 [Ignavibacteriaceae bacterium]
MEKTIKKFSSFEEAEKAEIEYWRNASPDKRINTLLQLQELMLQLYYPDVKGIKKVVKIKKLKIKS